MPDMNWPLESWLSKSSERKVVASLPRPWRKMMVWVWVWVGGSETIDVAALALPFPLLTNGSVTVPGGFAMLGSRVIAGREP